jgi:hypothetical protein
MACGSFLLPTFNKEAQSSPTGTVKNQDTDYGQREKSALFRAAESLRQRIGQSKEYEVIPEKEQHSQKPLPLKVGYGARNTMKP